MPLEESGSIVSDIITAEMVECVPPAPAPEPDAPRPPAPAATPTAQARAATIEQTGAGPPPERHPIEERPDLPLPQQIQRLTIRCAQLWDQVWWLSLPPAERAEYERQGFTAPILRFYDAGD